MKATIIFSIVFSCLSSFAGEYTGKVTEVIANNSSASELKGKMASYFQIGDRTFTFCGIVDNDYPVRAVTLLTMAMLSDKPVTILTGKLAADNCIVSVRLAK